jgi:hypothetical protein
MLSDAQEVKELQALGIGETTARHREARAPAVDENARKAMEEAQDLARKADFSDLRGSADGGLFTIDKTEERGLLLEQLRKVYAHIERRLASDRYWRAKPPGSKPLPITDPKAVTLYDAAKYVIKPATVQAQCSMVELMATASQLPKWFVSHWWGEPVAEFLACLTAHAKDRKLKKTDASYWICAVRFARRGHDAPPRLSECTDSASHVWQYANNQWRLDDSLTKDPSQ